MNDHVIDTLRAADPALCMPAESAASREATRESILQSGVRTAQVRGVPRTARSRRVLMVALAAALLVVVIPSAAWAYFSYFTDKRTVLEEYHAAQNQLTLPDGIAWVEPLLPDDVIYGSGAGYINAWSQSTDAWLREWVAAHEAGDDSRAEAAMKEVDRVLSLAPIHKEGDPEEAGGITQASLDWMRQMIDKAKNGDLSTLKEYLQANP